MLEFTGKAKISEDQRKAPNSAPFVPFSLSILIPIDSWKKNKGNPAHNVFRHAKFVNIRARRIFQGYFLGDNLTKFKK